MKVPIQVTRIFLIGLVVTVGLSGSPLPAQTQKSTRDLTNIDLTKLGITPVKPTKDARTGFVVGGKNATALIKELKEINGRTIAQLEKDMRPGAKSEVGSEKGFLGAEERLLDVLAADNRTVVDELGLTHQELAKHLLVLGEIGTRLGGTEFLYHGRRFKVTMRFARGFQLSPFHDGTKTNREAIVHNLDNGKKIDYSLLVPAMIERYGFYEGKGTPYRVDPRQVVEVFDFLKKKEGAKPKPDLAGVAYGPHKRHVLDLWKAKSDRPVPLVVFIHGGGFRGGSKEALQPALLDGLLANGISVMAINYRLSPEVHFPAHYLDCARAIQFARSRAKEWNIDPKRIGATGGSAGAGTSLWLGFHDDMVDPKSKDPVLRQSTRLSCMAVQGAQSSYDPRVIKEWVGEAAAKHPALPGFYGLKEGEFDTPKAHKLYEAASPINYLTGDDPPVYAFYSEARKIPADARPGQGIHHINFGLRLKEKMDKLGIECTVRHRDEGANPIKEMVAFFVKHLRPDREGGKQR